MQCIPFNKLHFTSLQKGTHCVPYKTEAENQSRYFRENRVSRMHASRIGSTVGGGYVGWRELGNLK